MGSNRRRLQNKPLGQVDNKRMEAKSRRRLLNKPLKDFAQIQIVSLLTGNVILPPTRYTQRMLDVHALSRMAGVDLTRFVVADGPFTLELHGLPIEKLPGGVCHVLQRPCQDYLFNVWGTLNLANQAGENGTKNFGNSRLMYHCVRRMASAMSLCESSFPSLCKPRRGNLG